MEYDGNHIILKNPSWWERRTNLERRTLVLLFILFLIVIILIIGFTVVLLKNNEYEYWFPQYSDDPDHPPEPLPLIYPICLEPGCIHAASTVLRFMDPSVKPCDDFYHFACGGFMNETNIPSDQTSVDSFTSNYDLLQEQLRTVVEEPINAKDLKPFVLLKKLYNKCMDLGAIESESLQTVRSILRNLGGWPVLDGFDWNENQFDWKQAVFKFRRAGLGVNYFLTVGVTLDISNSSRYIIELDQPELGPEESFLAKGVEDVDVKAYFAYMVDVATMFGAETPYALTELKAALEFEVALAKISVNPMDNWNSSTQFYPIRISELQRRYPTIPWLEYISGVVDLSDFKATYEDQVIVRSPQFITDFENLLRWTSKRVQANYIMWRAVRFSVDFLTSELRNRRNNFYRSVFQFDETAAKWEECVVFATLRMPFVMEALYVHKYIKKEHEEVVYEMVSDIRNEFMELIRGVDWMDDSTRLSAFDKVEAMAVYTAYSDELLSTKRLQQHYKQFEFSRNNFLTYILNLDLFERDKYYKRLRKHAHTSDWNTDASAMQVRPDYHPLENQLNIPSAVLQGIFFAIDRPQYLNYGALGYAIAHAITDGLDSSGNQYDVRLNMVNWWSEHTKRTFMRKAQCIGGGQTHHNASGGELYLPNVNTHELNVAYQGGLKAAYFGYTRWAERFGREFQLPGLTYYTPEQLFWISAAQTHCTRYRSEYLKAEHFTEQKHPAYFTVKQAFSNVEYFGRDFHCNLGTPMNPIQKCHVW